MNRNFLLRVITVIVAIVSTFDCARAQTFTGTNSTGTASDFSIQVGAGTTNIALTVGGSATTFSHLLLKSGVPANDSNYDFISQLDGQTNTLNIELPELTATNYFIRVRTPSNSTAHSFTLLVESNRTDVRTLRPPSKPLASTNSGNVLAGTWHYYRFEIPTNSGGWRVMMDSPGTMDLYVQKSQLPTTSTYLKRSTGLTNDLVSLTDAEAQAGAYFVGIFASTTSSYVLRTENVVMTPINFDAGLTADGTDVYTNNNAVTGDFFFKIRTASPALGAWRTALKVFAGEADLYMSRGVLPSVSTYDFKSDRIGSDGVVLASSQFSAGQDWYILVHAVAGSQWTLVSGAPYVTDLGVLATDSSSGSGNVTIGPEGMAFFQTSIPITALAWRLGIGAGNTNLVYVKKASVPLPISNELSQQGQMLVVPPYLLVGQSYFVGVAGAPGTTINLDSRVQPIADLDLSSSTNQVVTDFGYTTYRVQVPPSLIAWEVNVTPTSGNPNVSVRRSLVPNENYNDAFSENPGTVGDSVSLVPLILANGTWYITVYGTNTTLAFTLQNGPPNVTDINYSGVVTNDNPSKVGWRYYRVADTSQQSGTLGWDLLLTNYAPGTRIALRRTSVPSILTYRNPSTVTSNSYDLISTANFLQQPGHQADIWYIGVYNPSNALGPFTLITGELVATDLRGDGDLIPRTNAVSGKWEFFRLNLDLTGGTNQPVLGWDLRLLNVTSGLPRIIVRRDAFPATTTTTLSSPATATNWPSGQQWVPSFDWTRRQFSADGNTDEYGRILAAGAGRPLESAIYYIGIINTTGTNPMSYTVSSRLVENGYSLPMTELPYAGGAMTNNSLTPREAAYYHVTIPSGVRSWKVRLTTTSGEAMLVVSTNKLPNIESEKRMQKLGKEHYLLLPAPGQTNLSGGDYYLVVVAEGQTPTNSTRISTGACSYVIESLGAMPETDLGPLNSTLVYADTLDGGESKAYHFQPPTNSLGYVVSLTDRVGNPTAVVRSTNSLLDPGATGGTIGPDTYGNEGGESSGSFVTQSLITIVDPSTNETLMVKARATNSLYPDASYTLTLTPLILEQIPQLPFDGGTASINNQPANFWNYYRIDVPTNALGWDLRLTNVTSGLPQIVVARDHLPSAFNNNLVSPQGGTNWPTGGRWSATSDWTSRTFSTDGTTNQDGRILEMSMNRPLQPGTYYVGISSISASGSPLSYTIVSRGIGDGFILPARDLAFAGGSISITNLPIREAAYFRVQIPSNTPSWKVQLHSISGEAMMVALKDVLPNIAASTTSSSTNGTSPGRKMQKTNDEFFVLLPAPGQTNLVPGTYYLMAIAEGLNPANNTRIGTSNSTFSVTSYGPLAITDLGSLTADIYTNISLGGGETAAFQFTVTPSTYGFEIRLENTTGFPVALYRPGARLPDPSLSVTGASADTYGCEGGETTTVNGSPTLVSLLSPAPGVYSIVVKARISGAIIPASTFTLHIDATSPPGTIPFPFDGSIDTVSNQPANAWRFYAIDVPAGALGWDVRLTNVTSGNPKMVIRRDVPPVSLTTTPWATPGSSTLWTTSNQWAAAADWTRRSFSAVGTNEDGRILAMGMGRPLEPGQYIIGVTNSGGTNALSYTFVSRGIGTGYSLPVVNLPFNGGSANNTLSPREAAYYSIIVPSNAPSSKVRLQVTSGEAMMVCLSNRIPNIDTYLQNGTMTTGKGMQKSGNEHYLMLPAPGQFNIAPGTNYFAVIGEGANPLNSTRTGVGASSYIIQSIGPIPTNDLGLVTSLDLERDDILESGETKAYQFAVPFETLGFEFRLENRVGNPVAMYRPGTSWPDPGAALIPITAETYGNEGGYAPTDGNPVLITVPNPVSGIYSAVVKARANGGVFSDASYHLRIREILAPEINFGAILNTNGLNNTVSGTLEDNQRAFFVVHVPATYNGAPVLGWKLDLHQTSGSASVCVRKDLLPSDSDTTGSLFTTAQAIIAPPYLTNGTFYVEVRGSNSTAFTLTSNPVELERPSWVMPAPGLTNTALGLAFPILGDSGIDTNGVNLPGDQSIFLEQGYQHFYAIVIPTNNIGLVRVSLETSSGNPNVFARYNLVPSVLHNTGGSLGPIYTDRSMTSTNTEFSNWVTLDGKIETGLTAGTWYLMVRADGNANARYRLRVSAGDVQNLNIAGDGLTNQTLLSGDWRYYRVQMPSSLPLGWHVTFSQQSGDAWMYIRDTFPPGQGTYEVSYKDWATDAKNNGPYLNFDTVGTYSFSAPAVRPGAVYYVGFRAVSDSTFSVSVGTNGGPTMEPQTINFYGGSISTNLPPFSQVTYRIDVPPEAARWKHSSTHTTNLQLFIEQGTVPYKSTSDDFRSSTANSSLNQYLLNTFNAWPWVPNQSYFLTVTNVSSGSEPLTFTMDGRNTTTDDNDNDLLPDYWELAYFGNLTNNATGDNDGDGISNLDEYLEGTNPADNTSFRPRLTTSAANGSILRDVTQPSYAMGSTVMLTPVPNTGFTFVNWTGNASGAAVPYPLLMNGHKVVSALFKVIGDDFSTRVPLFGRNVTANGANIGATKEPGEPNHAGNPGGKSVWWTWNPVSGAPVTISTAGSTFNTVLGVYTGSTASNLTMVASDINSLGGTNRSQVTFTPNPCATYQIAVDGLWAASGYITLSINQAPTSLFISGPTTGPNGFQFTVQGDPNQIYAIDASPDLTNWVQIGFVTNGCSTAIPVTDISATNAPKRFYRFRLP